MKFTLAVLAGVLLVSACSGGVDDSEISGAAEPVATGVATTVAPATSAAPATTASATTVPDTTAAAETAPASTTAVATTTVAQTTTTEAESIYGPGGLIADLEGWADVDLPRFITASHIDVADVEYVSRFRSAAGHDFSDSFEGPSSMKHYYRPLNYHDVRFTQPIYSPVDGVILYLSPPSGDQADAWHDDYEQATGEDVPADHRDWDIFIRPDDAPNVWIQHQHVNPVDEIVAAVGPTSGQQMMLGSARPSSPGYRVKAGDLIAHGLGEIIVARHLEGSGVPAPCNSQSGRATWGQMPGCSEKRRFHSVFEFMTDEVFSQYTELAGISRDAFVVSAEERAAKPLEVDGDAFVDEGILEDPEAYVRLQEGPRAEEGGTAGPNHAESEEAQAEVVAVLAELSDLAAGRPVIAEFSASGTHTLEAFEAAGQFLLVISADAGPIGLLLDEGDGPRQIYGGPPGSEISTYETGWMGGGTITVTVEAPAEANWRLVAVAGP